MPALRKIPQVYKNRGYVGCGVCVIPPTDGNVSIITITSVQSVSSTSASVFFKHPLHMTKFTITYNDMSMVVAESGAIITGLTPQTQYSIVVTGDLGAKTLTSNTFMFMSAMPAPIFIYYTATSTSITIYFTAVSGLQLYVAGILGNPTEFKAYSSPITITGLTANNTYDIYLLTRDPNGVYPDSTRICYKMNTDPKLPKIITATPYITTIDVAYTNIPKYDLYYLVMQDNVTKQQVTTNPVTFTNVPENTTQNLYEIADDSTGQYGRVISDPVSVTTFSSNPPAIVITGYTSTSTTATISFTTYGIYTSYTLRINGFSFTRSSPPFSPITATGLTPNTTYYPYIHSEDSTGHVPNADGPTFEVVTQP